MPVVVEVLSADDYAKWVDAQKKKMAAASDDPNKTYTMDELKARGEQGLRVELRGLPSAERQGRGRSSRRSTAARSPTARSPSHVNIVLHGKGAMPPWATALNDVEIASVVTFERNSWGNHTGDLLQPKQVADARTARCRKAAIIAAAASATAPKRRVGRAGGREKRERAGPSAAPRARRRASCRPARQHLLRNRQEHAAGRRKSGGRSSRGLREGASGREIRAVWFHRRHRLRRQERELAKTPRASRARRAEGSGHRRRPHRFEEAGNHHGRRGCERSPACRDQSGCLTCRRRSGQGSGHASAAVFALGDCHV